MSDGHLIEALRKRLRLKARGKAGEVAVSASDLLTLLDEFGRVSQGADRLRRQNRRMRLRCQKLGVEVEVEDEPADSDT